MSNGWTPERRLRQSQLIQQWQPWKSAGVKTPEGKAISCQNSSLDAGVAVIQETVFLT